MSKGTLFNTQRLNRKNYEEYKKHVFSILDKNNIQYFSPFYYDDKETFGDLDIILPKPFGKNEIIEMFHFNKTQYVQNSNVHSICYKNFQIDFITTKPDKFEITKNYYSWADLSILIGRLMKKMNLSFGWEGLIYSHDTKIGSHYRELGNIYITDNMEKILSFIGLDYDIFKNGFKTRNDVFDYIIKSKFFNPKYFEYLNKGDARRNILLDDIVSYSLNLKNNFIYLDIIERDKIISIIDDFFTDINFKIKYEAIKIKEEKVLVNSDKFNGSIVMTITGLKNKELGDFISGFKIYACNSYGYNDFDDYVYESKKSNIQKDIELYLKQDYERK